MNADLILDASEMVDDIYIMGAREPHGTQPPTEKHAWSAGRALRRALVFAVVIAAILAFCGFAAYELGLFDPWVQKPSSDPTATVQSAIEHQINKEYTLFVLVDEVIVDADETKRIVEQYSGSALAKERGWTDEYLAEHFVVVWAKYYVEYDHTKIFMNDGLTEQYFYLTEDPATGKWAIVDNTSPNAT